VANTARSDYSITVELGTGIHFYLASGSKIKQRDSLYWWAHDLKMIALAWM
jgi:hypothetical protein